MSIVGSSLREQRQLYINKRVISAHWLRGILDDNERYIYIANAFALVQLLQQRERSLSLMQQDTQYEEAINRYNQSLQKNETEKKQQEQAEEAKYQQIKANFEANIQKILTMEKYGKTLNMIIDRQAQFQGENIYQLQSNLYSIYIKQTKQKADKSKQPRLLPFPQRFELQQLVQFQDPQRLKTLRVEEGQWTKSKTKFPSRLMFATDQRQFGYTLYFDSIKQGQDIRDFIIIVNVKKKFSKLSSTLANAQKIFNSKYASSFVDKISQLAEIEDQSKRFSTIQGSQAFLINNQQFCIKQFLMTWNQKAQKAWQKLLDARRLQQEELQQLQKLKQQAIQKQQQEEQQSQLQQEQRNQQQLQIYLKNKKNFFARYEKNILQNFVTKIKNLTQTKYQEEEKGRKYLHIVFKSLLTDSDLNLIQPQITVKLVKNNDGSRTVNKQNAKEGNIYYNEDYTASISGLEDEKRIIWSVTCRLELYGWNQSDQLSVTLSDACNNDYSTIAKKTVDLRELLSHQMGGKLLTIFLEFNSTYVRKEKKSGRAEVQLTTLLQPFEAYDGLKEQSFEGVLEHLLRHGLPFFDPVYERAQNLPKLDPKFLKLLEKTLERFNIMDEEMKYKQYQEWDTATTMRAVKRELILHYLKSAQAAEQQTQYDNIVAIEEKLVQQFSEEGGDTLSKLIGKAIEKHQRDIFSPMGRLGIPRQMRTSLWLIFGSGDSLQDKVLQSLNSFDMIRKFINKTAQHEGGSSVAHYDDEEDEDGYYYDGQEGEVRQKDRVYLRLKHGANSSSNIIFAQIREDVSAFARFQQSESGKFQQKQCEIIENVLQSYAYWITIRERSDKIFCYQDSLVILCDRLLLVMRDGGASQDYSDRRGGGSAYQSQAAADSDEETLFMLLLTTIVALMRRYYCYAVELPKKERSKTSMNTLATAPLQSTSIGGIKADLLLLKILVQETMPELSLKINELGLGLEHYFAQHLLEGYARLFRFDTLFRVWDVLFLEASLETEETLITTFISVAYTLLQVAFTDLIKAKSPKQFEAVLCLYGLYLIKADDFVQEIYINRQRAREKLPYYMNLLMNLEQELGDFYKNQCIQNLAVRQLALHKIEAQDALQLETLVQLINATVQPEIAERAELLSRQALNTSPNSKNYGTQYQALQSVNSHEDSQTVIMPSAQTMPAQNTSVLKSIALPEQGRERNNQSPPQQVEKFQTSSPGRGNYQQQQFQSPVLHSANRYASVQNPSSKLLQKASLKNLSQSDDPVFVHLYLHRLKLFWTENTEIVLEIDYGGQEQKRTTKVLVDTCIFLNKYQQFAYRSDSTQLCLSILEESKDQLDENQRKLVKMALLELNAYPRDTLVKTTLILRDVATELIPNYTQSELEISLIISSSQGRRRFQESSAAALNLSTNAGTAQNHLSSKLQVGSRIPQKFVGYFFKQQPNNKAIALRLEQARQQFRKDISNILSLDHISHFSLSATAFVPAQWRRVSRMSYEKMKALLKLAAPSLLAQGTDFGLIYNCILQNNESAFYLADLYLTAVLFTSSTFRQKCEAFYELLKVLDGAPDNKINLQSVKELAKQLFDSFMLYIPHNQLYQIIDYAYVGSVNHILKAKINFPTAPQQMPSLNVTRELRQLADGGFLFGQQKDVVLGDSESLSVLRSALEEKLQQHLEDNGQIQAKTFVVSITRICAGEKHKHEFQIDENWNILKRLVLDKRPDLPYERPNKFKPIQRLMHQNENIISLTTHGVRVSRKSFYLIMAQLPLLKYLTSYENFNNVIVAGQIKQQQESVSQSASRDSNASKLPTGLLPGEVLLSIFVQGAKVATVIASQGSKEFSASAIEQQYTAAIEQHTNKFFYNNSVQGQTSAELQTRVKIDFQAPLELSLKLLELELMAKYGLVFYDEFFRPMKKQVLYDEGNAIQLESSIKDAILGKKDGLRGGLVVLYSQQEERGDVLNFNSIVATDSETVKYTGSQLAPYSIVELNQAQYVHQALYYYSDFLYEWLDCRVEKKVLKENKNTPSYYAVRFRQTPNSLILRRPNEVLFHNDTDADDLEIIRVEDVDHSQNLKA